MDYIGYMDWMALIDGMSGMDGWMDGPPGGRAGRLKEGE